MELIEWKNDASEQRRRRRDAVRRIGQRLMNIYRSEEAWMQLMERKQAAITKKLPKQAKPLAKLDEWVEGAQDKCKGDEVTLQEQERRREQRYNVK